MKKFRKLTALVTAICLAGCMMVGYSASADDTTSTYSITISNSDENHTYEAYQIFEGDYAEGVLSNIVWGSGVKVEETDTVDDKTLLAAVKEITINESKPFASCETAADIAKILGSEDNVKDNSEVAKAFAKIVGKYLTNTTVTLEAAKDSSGNFDKKYTASISTPGYYLVKDKANTVPETSQGTEFILKVLGNETVEPKVESPTVLKKVKEDDKATSETIYGTQYNDVADYSIGQTVPFELIGTLPENLGEYDTYYYQFTDTLGKEFTIDISTIKVYVLNPTTSTDDDDDDSTVTYTYEYDKLGTDGGTAALTNTNNSDYIVSDLTEVDTNNDNSNDANKFTITFNNIKTLSDVTKDSQIVVRYEATLNNNAVIGLNGQENEVYLEYSNNPTNSGSGNTDTGKTPEDKVIVFTYELDITKYDGATGGTTGKDIQYLKEAEFLLYSGKDYNGEGTDLLNIYQKTTTNGDSTTTEYYLYDGGTLPTSTDTVKYEKVNTSNNALKTDANGKIKIKGLDQGTYYLEESKAPSGYNKLEGLVEIKIEANTQNDQSWSGTPADAFENFTDTNKTPTGLKLSVTPNGESTTVSYSLIAVTGEYGTNGCVAALIANNKGSSLPSTGGIGTTIFYTVGGVLVVGAGVTLISKKRMKNNER